MGEREMEGYLSQYFSCYQAKMTNRLKLLLDKPNTQQIHFRVLLYHFYKFDLSFVLWLAVYIG